MLKFSRIMIFVSTTNKIAFQTLFSAFWVVNRRSRSGCLDFCVNECDHINANFLFVNATLVSVYLVKLDSRSYFLAKLLILLIDKFSDNAQIMTYYAKFYLSKFQLVHPENKDIRDIPGLAPPVVTNNRRLLWNHSQLF
jgi:hypothetical protein